MTRTRSYWARSALAIGATVLLFGAVLATTPAAATPPGGDGRLVFYSDSAGPGFDVWTSELDGTDPVNLTGTPGVEESAPSWSPNGLYIVFEVKMPDFTTDLWLMGADGSDLVNVTNTSGISEGYPQFCGERFLVFHANGEGNFDIYLMPADGSTPPVGLTDSPANDFLPTCSADGSKIAWRNDAGGSEIWQMNRDGTGKENLTNHPAGDSEPDYSPEGGELLFTSDRDGNMEVFSMDLLTLDLPVTQLTFTAGITNETPAFFPSGLGLAYNSFNPITGARELFVGGVAIGSGGGPKVQPRVTCEVVEVSEGQYELRVTGTTGSDDIFVRRVPGHEEARIVEVVLDSKDVLCVVALDVLEGTQVVGEVTSLRIDAGDGDDHVTVSLAIPLSAEIHGGEGDDRIELGTLDEIFEGAEVGGGFGVFFFGDESGDEVLCGGDCTIHGGAGPDTIGVVGDHGAIEGGPGPDTVLSSGDGVTIDGGGGPDTIKVGGGGHEVDGGSGDDDIEKPEDILSEIEAVFVPSRPGSAANVGGGSSPSAARSGKAVLDGGGGNDTFLTRDGSRDVVVGGAGRDTATVDGKDEVRGVERVKVGAA